MESIVLNEILQNTIMQFCYGEPMNNIDFSIQLQNDMPLQQESDYNQNLLSKENSPIISQPKEGDNVQKNEKPLFEQEQIINIASNNGVTFIENRTLTSQQAQMLHFSQQPQSPAIQNQPINNSESKHLKMTGMDNILQKYKSSHTTIELSQPPQIISNSDETITPAEIALSSKSVNQNLLNKWVETFGPLQLKEAIEKLNTTEIALQTSYNGLSMSELQNQKKIVKIHLKSYNQSFEQQFRRHPQLNEKEPMRPLYIYYKQLKQKIQHLQHSFTKFNVHYHNKLDTMTDIDDLSLQKLQNIAAPSLNQQQALIPLQNVNQIYKTNPIVSQQIIHPQRQDVSDRINQVNHQQDIQSMEPMQIQKKIDELNQIMVNLKQKLHTFQIEFVKNNNRNIKFHKDIAPVEQEYQKCKIVRTMISKMKASLNNKTGGFPFNRQFTTIQNQNQNQLNQQGKKNQQTFANNQDSIHYNK